MSDQPVNLFGTRFEKVLIPIEKQLQLKLEQVRQETDHSLTIGERAEAELRQTLRGFIPPSFGIGHGKVYDAYGDASRQTDLIIANPDQPFSFPEDQAGWYILEGVAAAGEVKAVLTTAELQDAIDKATQFKGLRPTSDDTTDMEWSVGKYYLATLAGKPPFALVAFENKVAVETLVERLAAMPEVRPSPEKTADNFYGSGARFPIDVVCIIGKGILLDFPEDGGWRWIPTPAALAFTIGWLYQKMLHRHRGTMPFNPYVFPSDHHLNYMHGRNSFELEDGDEPPAD